MKLLSIALLAVHLQASANADAQQITLIADNASLKKVFSEIEKQSGYFFIYRNEWIRREEKVTVNLKNVSLTEALKTILDHRALTYTLVDKNIVIRKTAPPEAPVAAPVQQVRDVQLSGVVADSATGRPLPGVTVKVRNSNTGATTDAEGKFSLTVPEDAVLEVTYLGYGKKEVPVNGKNVIRILLAPEATGLNQLVVVGYGTQKKANVTGSISTISSKDLTTVPVANVTTALAGKLPGLIAVQRSGQPGADDASLSVRGFGNALVVVDGVVGREFSRLDPNEIESITVLKDAASAAVYGVSGGNGVILVTTKKGFIGKPELNYTFNYGVQHVTKYPRFVNSAEFATLKNEASVNSGGGLIYSPEEIQKYREGTDPNYPNFDYYDYFVHDYTPQIQQDLTIRGGSEKIRYFFLLGGLKQAAMWKGKQDYTQYNFRSNVDAQINDDLDISVQIEARDEVRNELTQDSYLMASWLQYSWPIDKPKTPDGKIASTNYGLTAYLDKDLAGYIKDNRRRYIANLTINYRIPFVEGLTAKIMASRDMYIGKTKSWLKKYNTYQWNEETQTSEVTGSRGENSLELANADVGITHIQPALEYDRTFSEKHHVSALLLFDETESDSSSVSATRVGYVVPIDQIFAGPDLNKSNGGTAADDGRESVVGRVNYDYMGKYLAEYSFRYDGSARFPPEKRWGYFSGVSAGWRLSEEDFIKNNSRAIDNLKLRFSWGKLGNDETGIFQFLTGYLYPSPGSYIFGNDIVTNGMIPNGIANPYITWEVSQTWNLGVDLDLWNGMFSASVDVFSRQRTGILAKRNLQLPLTFGATLPDENLNSDKAKGFEVVLNHNNQVGEINYNISANLSFVKSKWDHVEERNFSSEYDRWVNSKAERYVNRYFGLKAIGQFQSEEDIKSSPIQDQKANSTLRPGDIKYDDFNKDGVIDANDNQPLGRGETPEINYGLQMGLGWKRLSLAVNWQGAANFVMQQQSFLIAPFFNGMNAYAYLMDRWHREDMADPNSKWIPGKYPSTIESGAPNNMQFSSFWLKNATYLRLKSVNITYSFDHPLLKKAGIEGIDVSLSGQNLLTFSGLKYIDPEAPTGRLSYYPQQKTYNLALNIKF
ncbi:TonB-dependent receptor [Compostibacter hankyongensis]|uniref:TonB-dependent receptor n=1 Tax=Compostibacter hankyongensis TaxID=1007089 RepID=A0ABP8FE18_9BACT